MYIMYDPKDWLVYETHSDLIRLEQVIQVGLVCLELKPLTVESHCPTFSSKVVADAMN